MGVPTGLLWPRDPHTEAKHLILRGYLDAWWPILLSRNPQATYVEGYAGPGEYEGGEDGSPVIALRSLLQRQSAISLAGKRVNVVLVEEKADRLAHCLERINRELAPLPRDLRLLSSAGKCETALQPLLDACNAWGHPMLVVLDPFGAGVPYGVVRRVAKNRSSEVLVSFMSQWFVRWAGNEGLDQGDVQFGDTSWRAVVDVPSKDKRLWLVDRYRDRLVAAGFEYTVWFELVDEHGIAFSLIFGTRSRKGLEKMKEALWRVDPVRGIHFRDPRDPAQLTFDVVDEPQTASLANLLADHIDVGTPTLVEDLRGLDARADSIPSEACHGCARGLERRRTTACRRRRSLDEREARRLGRCPRGEGDRRPGPRWALLR